MLALRRIAKSAGDGSGAAVCMPRGDTDKFQSLRWINTAMNAKHRAGDFYARTTLRRPIHTIRYEMLLFLTRAHKSA